MRRKIKEAIDDTLPHEEFIRQLYDRVYDGYENIRKCNLTKEETEEVIQFAINQEENWNKAPNKGKKYSYFANIIKSKAVGIWWENNRDDEIRRRRKKKA